ncbi:MAG: glycosyltransferase family 2 protein [Pseudomonadota bacterium]
MMEVVFWASAAMLFYSFVGYALVLLAVSRLKPAAAPGAPWSPKTVSFIIAAHNEAQVIEDKLRNTLALASGGAEVEVILISDGSTDATAEIARSVGDPRVLVLTPGRVGKAAALGLGLERSAGEIVVFSDANAMLAEGSVAAMLRHFADPSIGGVCGRIVARRGDGGEGGLGFAEGLFWRYDQMLKRAESRLGGTVSAQGSVYAMRRDLAIAPEPGYADDFIISVNAVARGKRLAFEPEARADEIVAETADTELRRRVRSAELSWRSLMHRAELMNPFEHGWYAWQLASHKLVRRLNPLFLIGLLVSNLFLIGDGGVYALTCLAQIAFYGLAASALLRPELRRFKPASVASFFLMSHAAMAIGFLRYAAGRKSLLWTPSRESA